ncbi:MAG: hypothetical protein ACNI26_12350 [Terasakiella sp.]|uniref:hypothetical protein n=1 Tax=unclassified Terasakiella TaxID=2614952 RepID=UPI003AFF985D
MAVSASGPEIIDAEMRFSPDSATYNFAVTVRHDDSGWDHYADRYEIRSLEGAVLGVRVLAHPHVDEQPFTRSVGGIHIPKDLTYVLIRGRDNKGIYGEDKKIRIEP